MAPPTTMDDPARSDAARAQPDAHSAGALLRAARELQGMHIATLAAAIKVAPRKLEALEQDRWDELPGPTFTRALAQAVCRALKADPQPVMELLPPADTSMLDSTFGTINEPFAGRGGREPGWRGLLPPGPWLIAALALLLAAALVMWMPAGSWSRLLSAVAPAATSAGGEGAVVVNVPLAPAGSASAGLAATAPAARPVAEQAAAPGPAASPQVAALGGPTGGAGASQPPGAGTAAPAGALVIACAARTWVEVVDALGRVLLSRNLDAGETLGLDGQPPLQVVVGNAAATQVTYKGAGIDLQPRARDNVARFELK